MAEKINILIVDDDPSTQNFLSGILRDEGYCVQIASNGPEALKIIKRRDIVDFVISDLFMPNMNGLQLLEEIKRLRNDTMVVIMTGFGSIPTAVNAIKKGAYDYLMKPLDASAILLTIENALQQRKLKNQNLELQRELRKTKKFEHQSKQLSQQIDNLFYLNSVTQSISSSTHLKKLLTFVLENCKKVLCSQSASIFLVNESNPEELVLTLASGPHSRAQCGIRQKLGEGIAGQVAVKKQPLLVKDINKEMPHAQRKSHRYESNSFICFPLLAQNQLIGILNVTNKFEEGPFSTDDVNILSILAGHAASAIANLRYNNRLKKLNTNLQAQINKATGELIRKNTALHTLKQYNENIIHSISLGMIVFDRDLKITYCNTPMANLLAQKEHGTRNGTVSSLGLFDDKTLAALTNDIFIKQESMKFHHYEFTLHDRTPLHLDIIVSPFHDEHSTLIGGIIVVNNVTDQVILEQKLSHSERLTVVGKLAAKVAHELNNPLDGILRFIHLAIQQLDPCQHEDAVDYLQEAKAGTIRMAKIISSLLEFSRGIQPTPDKSFVNETVCDAVKAMTPAASSQNIAITTQLSKNLPKIPTGNLFQVLTDLIKNAMDAIDKDGTIHIQTHASQDSIIISVSDTGKGIPQSILPQIFDPFFTTKPKGKGSGLGLAICAGIIEECQGTLDVQSTENIGTTFTITLPPIEERDSHAVKS